MVSVTKKLMLHLILIAIDLKNAMLAAYDTDASANGIN